MNSFELQPTHENLMSTLAENLIDRNADICRFALLLNKIDNACAIALDGKWGSGKTFFVMQSKMVIEAYNPFFRSPQQEEVVLIKSHMEKTNQHMSEFKLLPQIPIYYDAWSHDNDVDPLLSLIYEIVQNVNTDFDFN